MRFWIRELLGWLLVGLGLFIFYICMALLLREQPLIVQAGPLVLIGIIVFRGGIHLLKVAVAARICLQTKSPDAGLPPPGTPAGLRTPLIRKETDKDSWED